MPSGERAVKAPAGTSFLKIPGWDWNLLCLWAFAKAAPHPHPFVGGHLTWPLWWPQAPLVNTMSFSLGLQVCRIQFTCWPKVGGQCSIHVWRIHEKTSNKAVSEDAHSFSADSPCSWPGGLLACPRLWDCWRLWVLYPFASLWVCLFCLVSVLC